MKQITAAEIKQVRSLGTKKFRDELGLFVVEGEKMVEEALKSGFEVERIYRKDEIGEEAMSRMSSLNSPSPVLAVVRQRPLNQKPSVKNGLYLALDSIRDPGNLGTIIRVADWFGIDQIVASPDTVEFYNPKVVQSTMGATFRINFCYSDIPSFAKEVLKVGGKVFGTFLDGKNMYQRELSTGKEAPSVIVIGNESNGISREVEALVSDKLYIPPYPADQPGSESLNAAIATAITISEFRRRDI